MNTIPNSTLNVNVATHFALSVRNLHISQLLAIQLTSGLRKLRKMMPILNGLWPTLHCVLSARELALFFMDATSSIVVQVAEILSVFSVVNHGKMLMTKEVTQAVST